MSTPNLRALPCATTYALPTMSTSLRDSIKSYDDATSSEDRVLYFGNRLTTPPDGLNL